MPATPQASDLEQGARQLLDQLDDLSVDVPKAPLQVRPPRAAALFAILVWCERQRHGCAL